MDPFVDRATNLSTITNLVVNDSFTVQHLQASDSTITNNHSIGGQLNVGQDANILGLTSTVGLTSSGNVQLTGTSTLTAAGLITASGGISSAENVTIAAGKTLTVGGLTTTAGLTSSGNVQLTGTSTLTAAGLITASGGISSAENVTIAAGKTLTVGGSITGNVVRQNSASSAYASGSGAIAELRHDLGNNIYRTNQSNTAENVFLTNGATVTLPAGLWWIQAVAGIANVFPTKYRVAVVNNLGSAYSSNITNVPSAQQYVVPNNNADAQSVSIPMLYAVSTSTTFIAGVNIVTPTSSSYNVSTWIHAVRLA